MLRRGQKNDNVFKVQRRLQALGLLTESVIQSGKGSFGPATQRALQSYFGGLLAKVNEGTLELEHIRSLFPFPFSLPDFNGDSDFIHALEGHAGKAYWPKGKSGITLDPGCDLGYIDATTFTLTYNMILTEAQMDACLAIIKLQLRGPQAQAELKRNVVIQSIRINRSQADDAFPKIASDYWAEINHRFPILVDPQCPPSIQTALLSLAYNRGPDNKGLAVLGAPLAKHNWSAVAEAISEMQQDHKLSGIRTRRKLESNLIKKELSL